MSHIDSIKIIHTELSLLLSADYSDDHKRDMKQCIDKFLLFLISSSLYDQPLSAITSGHVAEFLNDFETEGQKGKYYYNQYKRLNILFNILVKKGYIKANVAENMEMDKKQIENSTSDKSFFDTKTLDNLFKYLKTHDKSFYLFAKINYFLMIKSSVLRKLKRNNFNVNLTTLIVKEDGSDLVYDIPDAMKSILFELKINELPAETNIFTKTSNDFSQSTFFKKWAKLQSDMHQKGVVEHDAYEFEAFSNSMVYELYSKNGDVYEIQKLLKRSTVYKTKEYLKKLFGDSFESIPRRGN